MKAWWSTLQTRERLMVVIGALCLGIIVLWLMVWEPLSTRRDELSQRVEAAQETLVWMQQASRQIEQQRTIRDDGIAASTDDGRSLLSVIDASAKQANLRKPIQRMDPQGDNGVDLWIEGVDFDELVRWLSRLQREHGIEIESISVDRTDEPGRIESRLSLQRL